MSTQRAIIIAGFPCIGKSTFKNSHLQADGAFYNGYEIVDHDSKDFKKRLNRQMNRPEDHSMKDEEWVPAYVDFIVRNKYEHKILLVSTHREVLRSMGAHDLYSGLSYIVVAPTPEVRRWWLQGLAKREGTGHPLYRFMSDRYEAFTDDLERQWRTGALSGCRQLIQLDGIVRKHLCDVIPDVFAALRAGRQNTNAPVPARPAKTWSTTSDSNGQQTKVHRTATGRLKTVPHHWYSIINYARSWN